MPAVTAYIWSQSAQPTVPALGDLWWDSSTIPATLKQCCSVNPVIFSHPIGYRDPKSRHPRRLLKSSRS